jgi:hypothetical protein
VWLLWLLAILLLPLLHVIAQQGPKWSSALKATGSYCSCCCCCCRRLCHQTPEVTGGALALMLCLLVLLLLPHVIMQLYSFTSPMRYQPCQLPQALVKATGGACPFNYFVSGTAVL